VAGGCCHTQAHILPSLGVLVSSGWCDACWIDAAAACTCSCVYLHCVLRQAAGAQRRSVYVYTMLHRMCSGCSSCQLQCGVQLRALGLVATHVDASYVLQGTWHASQR
jgi:hypothetical protein